MRKRYYNLIDQEKNCCVAAVLQMILERRKLYVPRNQESILKDFKRLDISDKTSLPVITDLTDQFFKPRKYPLKETFTPFSMIEKYDDELIYMMDLFISSDIDMLIFVNYTFLRNDPVLIRETMSEEDERLLVKHVFLVSDIIDSENIFLVCPEVKEVGGTEIIKTSTKELYRAMNAQKDKSGLGYSIIDWDLPTILNEDEQILEGKDEEMNETSSTV